MEMRSLYRSGLAHFKAKTYLSSSQRLGVATLLPLGTFVFSKSRESQNWVEMF